MEEYLEAEIAELKQKLLELGEENAKLRHSLALRSPLDKEEAKLLGLIHKCKIELKKQPLKKTGFNKHNNYAYFELGDFLPCLEVILDNHGLGSYCYFEDNIGYLVIFDVVSGVFHSWDTPCKMPHVKENGFDVGVHMKAEQAVQTYARRTLYLQAFDIVEPNSIEQEGKAVKVRDVSHLNKPPRKDVKPKQEKPPVKEEEEEEPSMEVSSERVKEILDIAYERVTDAGKEFTLASALWTLKKLCENDAELRACKEALKMYTADKVKE